MKRRKRGFGRRGGTVHVHKADGSYLQRVKQAGPKRSAFLVVDPAKKRHRVLLANWYSEPLMETLTIENTKQGLERLVAIVKAECEEHKIKELVVGVERTGRYYKPVYRVLK